MTKIYNVLEKCRTEAPLSDAEKDIYEAGLIGVLRRIHDDIDVAVAKAYGWPDDLSDAEFLERLVALNRERAAEEREGTIRWLRPDFQAPRAGTVARDSQVEADLVVSEIKVKKPSLPTKLPDQVAAIRELLETETDPIAVPALARRFAQGKRVEGKVGDLIETLVMLGQAEAVDDGFVLKG